MTWDGMGYPGRGEGGEIAVIAVIAVIAGSGKAKAKPYH
jgi:hypothetical protein